VAVGVEDIAGETVSKIYVDDSVAYVEFEDVSTFVVGASYGAGVAKLKSTYHDPVEIGNIFKALQKAKDSIYNKAKY